MKRFLHVRIPAALSALAAVWIVHSGSAARFKQAPWVLPGAASLVFFLSLIVTCFTISARYY